MKKILPILFFALVLLSSQLWGQEFHLKIDAHNGPINTICFSPDGKYLASCSNDNYLRLWDASSGTLIQETYFQWQVKDISFSPDGKMLCCVSDLKVFIFDVASWEKLFIHKQSWNLTTVAFSKDGSFIAYGDSYGKIGFIKVEGDKISKQNAHSVSIKEITFNNDGRIFTTTSVGNVIKIWNLENNKLKLLKIIDGQLIRISEDGTFISVRNNTFNFWSLYLKEDKPLTTIYNQSGRVTGLVLTSRGFITSSADGSITFWTRSGEEIKTSYISEQFISDIDVSNDYSLLACAMKNGKIILYKNLNDVFIGEKEITSVYVKNYVEENINDWQKKGRYEKTVDFKNRVNEETREIQIELYTQEAINNYILEEINWDDASADYDADNESFKLTIDGIHTIIVPVPLNEARLFDDSFNNLKYTNPKCVFTDDFKPAISYLEIYNPANEKVYVYDSKDQASFAVAKYSFNFEEIEVILPQAGIQDQQTAVNDISIGKSDVDLNIPSNYTINDNIYALVIGNEDYSSYQTGLGSEVNVKFANNDAKVFKEYLMNTMGVPEDNIHLLLNATYGQSMQYLSKLEAITEILGEKAEIIFYYSGHGFPDEVTKEPYIMPVDASATNLISAIKLNQIYGKLTKHPTKRVTIFLDACFSGGARNQGLLAARSVKIKPQENQVNGNVVVFTASSGIEPALGYDDKQHGMFTYYLLKKFQESQGDLSYQELGEYIQAQVELQSVVINNKRQKPQINLGSGIDERWGEWRFVE